MAMGQFPKYVQGEKGKRQRTVSVIQPFGQVSVSVCVYICNICKEL